MEGIKTSSAPCTGADMTNARSRISSPLKDTIPAPDASSSLDSTKPKPTVGSLLSWQDVSAWQQDNRFIRSHYRPESFSYISCLASVLNLHNQSINIYTHLVGTIFFISGAFWFHQDLVARYESASQTDVFVFDCFFFGAISCLTFSVFCA